MAQASPTSHPERCTTGVDGLDEVLHGGFPRNHLYLIQGDPGAGKTTLALQFLLNGARRGETGLYITFSETKTELETVAKSHGWDLSAIHLFDLSTIEEKIRGDAESTFFHPSEIELNRTTSALMEEIERISPTRVVFDSLSEMRMLAETPLRYRRQILQLKQYLAGRKITVVFLDDRSAGSHDLQVESIAHGVVALERTQPDYGISRRRLCVMKIRGSAFREGNHDLVLQRGGMVVFPRLRASEQIRDFAREPFPSGNQELDALLGGGLDRGTSNMFMGPPGTGKSTLTIKFVHVAAERGEASAMFIFDETVGMLLHRAAQLGMDLRPHVESGLVSITHIDPAEISPGELANRIWHAVQDRNARIIVLDSINGYLNAMLHERDLTLQLHELLSCLNQLGIITIMVLAQQGLIGPMQASVDLTYLADSVLLLRYFEAHGSVRQAISIIKKRSGNHERTIREISVTAQGIAIGEPLYNFHGVLTGVPSFAPSTDSTPGVAHK
jgi:circadian clock protein KaiC